LAGNRRARLVLETFLLTFIAARVIVYLIMSRRMPDLYLHLGGTHVHHLNYGIFLLCGVGAYLLFARVNEAQLDGAAIIYGIGLALTFDEFGMWVHLGGDYWQRASFDAVCVVAGLLALVAFAPSIRDFQRRHWIMTVVFALLLAGFAAMLYDSLKYAERKFGAQLEQLESQAPQ
jgi:hypothetical protein